MQSVARPEVVGLCNALDLCQNIQSITAWSAPFNYNPFTETLSEPIAKNAFKNAL
jgi:hypothetical protein